MKLSGNTILITGGATGIGLAMAGVFIERGNRVIICGRRQEKLDEARQRYPELVCHCCDVSNAVSRQQLFDALVSSDLSPNVLINNAAVMRGYDLAAGGAVDLDQVEQDLQTNFLAPVALIELFLPVLTKQADAVIINVSSPGGVVPVARVPFYCASKAALDSYTKSLRFQLNDRIEVIEMYPPSVATAMMDQVDIHKVSTARFGRDFIKSMTRGGESVWVGEGRYLKWINAILPRLAYRLVNQSARVTAGMPDSA